MSEKLGMPKVLAIVPAFNEEENIAGVVQAIRASAPFCDVLVVNDGSRDATSAMATAAGAMVIDLPFNLGIGGAMQTGYKFAWEMGYEIAVQVDGDGQHPPEEIAGLVQRVVDGEADMVVGSRYKADGYTSTFTRIIGAKVLALAVSLATRQKITDTTSGFRAINRKLIRLFAQTYPRDYPEPEALVLLRREGFTVKEVPVAMRPRQGGVSSITSTRAVYYMVKVLLAIIIDLFKGRVLKLGEK